MTDTLGLLVGDGEPVAVQLARDPLEVEGVNTRVELAACRRIAARPHQQAHMLAGVTIVDRPTWIEADVKIEPDVVVHPYTVVRGASGSS